MNNLIAFISLACLIRLGPNQEERVVSVQEVRFYEDTTRQISSDQIISNPEKFFKFNPSFSPNNYNPDAAYWVEYNFCIEDQYSYLIEFFDQTIDSIEVHIRHASDSTYGTYQFGDQYDFLNRQFDHKNFEIPLKKPGEYTAYVRIANREYADIRIAIRSINRFVDYALTEYYLYGIFYGMILIISLYNIFLYSAIREVKYLYYTFYILSVGLYAMCVDGIAFQMLWPGLPNWNTIAHGIALFSIISWSIIFSKKFLNLKVRAPKVNRLLNVVFALRACFFLYALFIDNHLFTYRYIEIIPLSTIFIGSIQTYTRGYQPARFFIVAYGFLFFGFVLKTLVLFSIIPTSWTNYSYLTQALSYYSLHLCFVLEMLFLSIALSDRVRILKENRNRAFRRIVAQHEQNIRYKDKLNQQLEQKIQARTIEIAQKNEQLEHSNKQLENQKIEISEINSMLDLDNWKLRNNLKSIQTERLLNKMLSFEEFLLLFPNKARVLKFLSEHKWHAEYSCKKCQNKKHIKGSSPFARRCSRCGYNETPTTDTIFHGIKFPLQKAMYILYLTLNNDHRNNAELSAALELRVNTIWAFRKKIEKHISQYGRSSLDIFQDLNILA